MAHSISVPLDHSLVSSVGSVKERAASTPRVAIIRTIEEVQGLRDKWMSWEGHPDSDLDVYLSLFKCRSDVLEPYVVVLYRDGRPDALLVTRIVRKEVSFKVGYLRAFHTTLRALDIPYGGLRGNSSPENCRLLVAAVISALNKRHADIVTFDPLRVDSPLYSAVHEASSLLIRANCPAPTRHRYLAFLGGRPNLYRARPKARHLRNNFANRLKAQFGCTVCIRRFTEPGDIADLIGAAEQVAQTTYQRALGVGFAAENPQICELLRLASDRGWLRAYVLYAEGKPISFVMGTLYGETVYLNFLGFDRTYERFWPGIYLLICALEELCSEGVAGVDFGIGDAVYKQRLSNQSWEEAPVHLFRLSFQGVLLDVCRTVTQAIDRTLKMFLQKVGLLEVCKGIYRSHVAGRNTQTKP